MIVQTAIEFLEHHPYRELNAGVLMAPTGLSRPAFYQYYRNVPALIADLLGGMAAEMGESAVAWLAQDGDRVEALYIAFRGIAGVVQRHGKLFRAIVEAAPLDDELETVWGQFMGHWIVGVAARIRHEQQTGLIDPSLDADRISRALNSMDVCILVDSFGKTPQEPLEKVVETIVTIWRRTLYHPDAVDS